MALAMTIEPPSRSSRIAELVSSIGGKNFENEMMNHVNDLYGADYCSIFRYENDNLELANCFAVKDYDLACHQTSRYVDEKFWKRDKALYDACQADHSVGTIVKRIATESLMDLKLRDTIYKPTQICERVLVVGGDDSRSLIISLLRTEKSGCFSERELGTVAQDAQMLICLIEKHFRLLSSIRNASTLLTSLPEVEARIRDCGKNFPQREIEVCSRIIYGMSSIGIAIEMGITDETVTTYRKRIYQRLEIGSQRELILWYLSLIKGFFN